MTDPALPALIALLLPAGAFVILAVVAPLRRSGRPAAYLSVLFAAGALAAALAPRRLGERRLFLVALGVDSHRGWPAHLRGGARRRRLRPHARPGRPRLLPRPGLFAGLSLRRACAVSRPLQHVPVPLRVLDDGAGARAQLRPAFHQLGAGGPLLLSPDWLLVSAAGGSAGGHQGLLDHQGG